MKKTKFGDLMNSAIASNSVQADSSLSQTNGNAGKFGDIMNSAISNGLIQQIAKDNAVEQRDENVRNHYAQQQANATSPSASNSLRDTSRDAFDNSVRQHYAESTGASQPNVTSSLTMPSDYIKSTLDTTDNINTKTLPLPTLGSLKSVTPQFDPTLTNSALNPGTNSEKLARWQVLADKSTWTDADRAEAMLAYNELKGSVSQNILYDLSGGNSKYTPGLKNKVDFDSIKDKSQENNREQINSLYNTLYGKLHSGMSSVMSGLIKGTGADSIGKVSGAGLEKLVGDSNPDIQSKLQREMADIDATDTYYKNEHPVLYGAGNIAGNLALLAGGSGVAEKAVTKLPQAIQAIAKNAITFAGTKAIQDAGDVATGQMSGKSYARDIAVSGVGGAAGTIASGLVSSGLAKVLVDKGLQTPFMEYVRATAAGTAFGAGDLAAEYTLSDKKPDKSEIATQLVTAFLLSAIQSGISAYETTAENKSQLETAVAKMQYAYTEMGSGVNSEESAYEATQNMLKYSADIRNTISKTYYAGQQSYVNQISNALDALDEAVIVKGYAEAKPTAKETPSEPAPVSGTLPATTMPEVANTANAVQEADFTNKITEALAPEQTNAPAQPANIPSAVPAPVSQSGLSPVQSINTPAPAIAAQNATQTANQVSKVDEPSEVEIAHNKNAINIASSTLGEHGAKAINFVYDGKTDSSAFFQGFTKYYNAGQAGKNFDKIQADTALSDEQKHAAYFAGQNDIKTATETSNVVLNSPKTESTIKSEDITTHEITAKPVHEQIANEVYKYISKGQEFNSARLFEIADKAYGSNMASGAYSVKDAYDAMELATNKYVEKIAPSMNGDAKNAVFSVKKLNDVLTKIPTQTKRTDEQQSFQQFSTPPTIAYLAAWAADVSAKDTVLEPSAGIGGLATFPKAWGAKVIVNELSERRLELLKSMKFDAEYNLNAEQLNNLLPDDVKPSVVLMNPPFSSTAGRTATNKTSNAERHIEQALLRLNDGGRLVAILGKGMANDALAFKAWWDALRTKYNIRANIGIDGSNYSKYGTTFGVQLVVIDKTGPQTGEIITGNYKDLTEIPKVLEGIRNDRIAAQENTSVSSGLSVSGRDTQESTGISESGNTERINGNSAGNKHGGALQGDNERGAKQPQGNRNAISENGSGKNGKQLAGSSSDISGYVRDESESIRNDKPLSEHDVQGLNEESPKISAKDNGVFAEYVPAALPVKGAKKHPAPLVESAAMAAVNAPKATYVPDLPRELISTGAISDAQLLNIIYAGQAHEQILPDGSRKGYFIGDGTGVGKGRQISGIILDNFRQGRKKAVWVSNNAPLFDDARRDWSDIGGNKDAVFSQAKVKLDGKIAENDGILFTTYDTLKTEKGQSSRLQQIINWVGQDFDGVIAFDEAHNMSNLLGKQSGRGKTKPAAKALAGLELQNALPNARVVYVSATGATDVNELAFAQRLGLWGKGTQFNNVNDFVDKISSGGLAAMELVARDMKSSGLYQARSISYDGVSYDTLQHDLTPMQTQIYNNMCQAWQVTLNNIEDALNITGAKDNPNARSAARSAYYGAMQRFYNQVLTSMSMPSVIADIKKELAGGHSCVLQIVNTNQAEAERQIAKAKETGASLDEMDLTPKGTLITYLENSFPIYAYEEYTDDEGNLRSRLVTDKDGNPVIDKQALALRDDMIARVKEMSVPEGPLEMLFDAFGTDQVAEVTGRTRRVVPKTDANGETKLVEESRTANHVAADVQAFQDGKKHILVFSDAGGTGKSYHADRRAKNQEQRIHYLLQAGWSASKATQGFGRTHRSNQVTIPQFKLVTTNIMGQKRFISTIARRLDQLGALTKGQRETGSGMFGAKDNLESDLARDSLRNFYDNLGHNRIDGVDGADILKKLGLYNKFTDEYGTFKLDENVARDMNTFLNRILTLEVEEQNIVFGEFNRIFETNYDKALQSGTLDLGLENVKADKIEILDNKVIRTDENTGATTNYVQAKTYKKPNLLTSIAQLENYRSDFRGIYRTDKGDVRAVYRIADKTNERGNIQKMYRLQSAVTTKSSNWTEESLQKNAEKIDKSKWAAEWETEVKKAPEYIDNTVHMLTGTLLPIWNRLPQEGNTRVMRIIADDGSQYLGRVIAPNQIDFVLNSLGAGKRTKENYTAPDLMNRILKDNATVALTDNRIKLGRRRVSGEYRIEISGQNVFYLAQQYKGIITETISYERRYFLPTGEAGETILANLIKDNPVSDVSTGILDDDTDRLIKSSAESQSVGSNKKMLEAYSEHQKENWANSKNIVIYESQAQLEKFAEDAIADSGNHKKLYLGMVPDKIAARIHAQTGLDIAGYNCTLRADEIRKILKDHGNELTETPRGQRAITITDILNIPDILIAPDDIKLSDTPYEGKPAILFIKTINGRTTVVSYVSSKHHDMTVQTMYSGKNKGSLATTPSGVTPFSQTSETLNGTASEVNISLAKGNVKVDKMASIETPESKWTAKRVGSSDKVSMPLSDIIGKIRHDFGIPVTTGNIRGGKTLGEYRRESQSIRTKIANDLPTVAHELGHHFDNQYKFTSNLSKDLISELTGNLTSDMKGLYPEDKWKTEGFAEFIRHYLQNSETTAIDYPNVTQAFLDTLSDVDAGLIEQLADEVNAYYALDVDSASSSIRLKEEGGRDFRTPGEKLKDAGNEFYEAWIDSNRAIRLLDRENSTNTYKLATNAAYADNVALSILENALTDINGKYVSSSLLSRVKKIKASDKDVWRQFGEYLIVCDGPDRLKEGKRTFADDRKNSSKWMEFREKTIEHEHPEFKEAAKELYKFQHDFLWTWGVGTGLVSAESATDYEERHPKYVPFNRAIGKGHNGIKKQFANQSSTIHRAIGSGLDIVHPVDNIINNVTLMVKAGIYNNVMAEITKTAIRNEAMAFWLEKVQAPIKVTKYNAVELKEKLKQTVHEAGFKESDEDAVFGIIDNIDDILYQYGRGKAHGDVVTVLKNGKPEFWKINDAQLLASITNMSPKRLPAWLVAYGEVSRFMVSNITGNNVLWSIFSNFPRDIMTMWTFSADKNPLHILSGIGSAYLNKINPNKNDPLFREYLAMGGGHMSVYTADKSYTRNFRKKITGDKLQYLNPLELLEFVSDTVELGPRFSYYKIMRNRGLSPTEAFYEASDITTNFRRGGQMSQTINNVIPFFNASVQGLDKFARWTTAEEAPVGERKKAVKGRMLAFLLASLGLAGLMYGINHKTKKDGDNYAQLSNYTKNSYWCLPLGDGKYFTIPKPREIAVLSSLFEANMERYIAGDIHALDEFYQYATNTMLPNAVSNLAQGDFAGAIGSLGIIGLGAYMMSNRDFLGNPIVSSGLQSLEPKSQYTDRTSKLAYWIGQAFGTSPQMVDYFFQNTLGGWWKAQKALFPVGSENTDLTLGIQGQYVRDNQYSTDIVNRLYDAGTEAAEKSKSNPADSNASVKAKWYSTMTTFYSRYYALAKDKDDTTAHRAARQTVLNMISQFEKQMDSGSQTTEQKTVENISNQAGTTDYMPGVMQSAIKDDNGTSYTLSDTQYIDYQTNYLTNYYNSVEAALNAGNKDVKTQTDILKAAKDNARTNATAKALSSLGVTTKDFTQSQSAAKVGLTDSDMILYQAALDMANDDGSLKQEEVISILKSMDLTDNERSFLFLQKYKAKNNPFD